VETAVWVTAHQVVWCVVVQDVIVIKVGRHSLFLPGLSRNCNLDSLIQVELVYLRIYVHRISEIHGLMINRLNRTLPLGKGRLLGVNFNIFVDFLLNVVKISVSLPEFRHQALANPVTNFTQLRNWQRTVDSIIAGISVWAV